MNGQSMHMPRDYMLYSCCTYTIHSLDWICIDLVQSVCKAGPAEEKVQESKRMQKGKEGEIERKERQQE